MSKYTLHYFGVNGRAIISRAILSFAKADWTNDMIERQDWPKIKTSGLCEFEQLPVLEVNGKKYCESNAINLYLAETFNLMGKDAEENYQIVNLLMTIEDIYTAAKDFFISQDESKKEEFKKKAEDKVKFFFGKFENRYADFGKKKYFLGDKFTLADIFLTCALNDSINTFKMKDSSIKEIAPNVVELAERIKENELKEFFEKYFIKK